MKVTDKLKAITAAGPDGTKSLLERAIVTTPVVMTVVATILASLNGYAPAIAVEFGRKVLFSTERPSFSELEEHVRRVKAK